MTTYDYADRPATLLARRAGQPDQPLVTGAAYLSAGPLSSLTLGNGLTEVHAFTTRYFPSSITLGSHLSWTYSTDAVGNILSITDILKAANNRSYGYQDIHYFLTQGSGPWGPRTWTYDRIGNRLTETRGAVTDTYSYTSNGTGRTPILSQVQLGTGGTRTYQFDPAGHLEKTAVGADSTLFLNDAAGRLAALERPSTRAGAAFRYDGRDYLALADSEALAFLDGFETADVCAWSGAIGLLSIPVCTIRPALWATYNSEGLLHSLHRNVAPQSSYVFYFTGRPVAQLDISGGTESWKWLTADHLGTPIAATGTGGALLWQGGFEPFGADWSGASGAGVFLRFPGQWEEGVWGNAVVGLLYNVHRWYGAATGRYTQPDPIGIEGGVNLFLYAQAQPVNLTDPLGLFVKNNTNCVLYIKASHGATLRELQPGELWPVEFDGFADPCKHPDQVFKVVDLVDIEVDRNHRPQMSVRTDQVPWYTRLGQSRRGGWQGRDWLSDIQKKNDHDWDKLFDKSRKQNCCCKEPN